MNKNNKSGIYAKALYTSEIDRYDPKTNNIINKLSDGCIYIPNFFCKKNDRTIFNSLQSEIDRISEVQLVEWSKHHKFENPDFSETFNKIVDEMAKHFNVEVSQTRLNFYKDNSDWKPLHHDRHAYEGKKEDFTMGASFGYSRELEFLHVESGKKFKFPQNNGDVFAFDTEINKIFMHGVPKTSKKVGPRFSIIAWGTRFF